MVSKAQELTNSRSQLGADRLRHEKHKGRPDFAPDIDA